MPAQPSGTPAFADQIIVASDVTLSVLHERRALVINSAAAVRTVTIPLATTFAQGAEFLILCPSAGTNKVTIDFNAGDLINGAANADLELQTNYAVLHLISAGGNGWYVVPPAGSTFGTGFGVPLTTFSYSTKSQPAASGRYYAAGFYEAPAADANLSELGGTQTLGGVNGAVGAHAFLVAAAAGTAGAGTGVVEIEVSGTSIDDDGNRTPTDTEVLVADVTTLGANDYVQTTRKWIGQVTYTLQPTGTIATYALDFNYGFAKYENLWKRDFTIAALDVTGYATATDANFDLQLFLHSATGWTYSAAAFIPGGTVVADLQTDYNTEFSLIAGEPFAWRRENLSQAIDGDGVEGFVLCATTSVNGALEMANFNVGINL